MANDKRRMPGFATTVKLLVMLGRMHHKRRDGQEEKCDMVTEARALPENKQPTTTTTTTTATAAVTVTNKAANERRQSSTSSSDAQLALSTSTSLPSSMSSRVLPLSEAELLHSSSSGVSPCPL
jgi:hypothetical protein